MLICFPTKFAHSYICTKIEWPQFEVIVMKFPENKFPLLTFISTLKEISSYSWKNLLFFIFIKVNHWNHIFKRSLYYIEHDFSENFTILWKRFVLSSMTVIEATSSVKLNSLHFISSFLTKIIHKCKLLWISLYKLSDSWKEKLKVHSEVWDLQDNFKGQKKHLWAFVTNRWHHSSSSLCFSNNCRMSWCKKWFICGSTQNVLHLCGNAENWRKWTWCQNHPYVFTTTCQV